MNRLALRGIGSVVTVVVGLNFTSGCATSGYDGPCPGETCYVSTEKISLQSAPEGLSPRVKELAYRDSVKVKEVVRVAPPFAGDKS